MNKQESREQQRRRTVELRSSVLDFYERYCNCCEIIEPNFLGIDKQIYSSEYLNSSQLFDLTTII